MLLSSAFSKEISASSLEEWVLEFEVVMLYVSQTIHDQSASLNTACVLQRLYYCPEIIQHNRSACRTAAHDMLHAQLETCNHHLNPGLSIQSLS